MYVELPVFRELRSRHIDANLQDHSWRIGVPRQDSSYWATLISVFIKKIHFPDLDRIIGNRSPETDDESSVQIFMRRIEQYNPFVDRCSCFHDAEFKRTVKSFEEKATLFRNDEYEERDEYNDYETCIDVIAQMLGHKITVVLETSEELNEPEVLTYGKNYDKDVSKILLFCKGSRAMFQVSSFGLPKVTGNDMQKSALKEILRIDSCSDLRNILESLQNTEGAIKNVFLALIDAGRERELENLLQKPHYILDKLHDACFPTDPTDGRQDRYQHPVFYRAIVTGRVKLLYLLYEYAVRRPSRPEISVRKPDPSMMKNMDAIQNILEETKRNLEIPSEQSTGQRHRDLLEELIKFHEYRKSVCDKIRKNVTSNHADAKGIEALPEGKIVLSILQMYNKYFNMTTLDEEHVDKRDDEQMSIPNYERDELIIEKYSKFKQFCNYFQNLDHAAILWFFDHTSSLRSKIALSNDLHELMDSNFLRFILFLKFYYSRVNEEENFNDRTIDYPERFGIFSKFRQYTSDYSKEVILLTAHAERLQLREILGNFIISLLDTTVDCQNRRRGIPMEEEVNMLSSQPEIKSAFALWHLKYYMQLVRNADLDNNFQVESLLVLRALQVLGEATKLKCLRRPSVIDCLLASMFPGTFSKELLNFRNVFCDLFPRNVSANTDIRNDKQLLLGVKTDLQRIDEALDTIINFGSEMFLNYLIDEWKSLGEIRKHYADLMSIPNNECFRNGSSNSEQMIPMHLPFFIQNLFSRIPKVTSKEFDDKQVKERILNFIRYFYCLLEFSFETLSVDDNHEKQPNTITKLLLNLRNAREFLEEKNPAYDFESMKSSLRDCEVLMDLVLKRITPNNSNGEVRTTGFLNHEYNNIEKLNARVKKLKNNEAVHGQAFTFFFRSSPADEEIADRL